MDLTIGIAWIIIVSVMIWLCRDMWRFHKKTKEIKKEAIKLAEEAINMRRRLQEQMERAIHDTLFYGAYTPYCRCDICGANVRIESGTPDKIRIFNPEEFNRCQGACGHEKIMDTATEHRSE